MKELMKRLLEVNKSLNESELDALFPDYASMRCGRRLLMRLLLLPLILLLYQRNVRLNLVSLHFA